MNQNPNNQLISKKRGKKWKENLVAGRMEVQTRPSYLRIIRAKYKHPQVQVAKKLSLTPSTYAAIERGKRTVGEEKALQILKHFGLTSGQFKKYFKEIRKKRFLAEIVKS